MTRSRTVVSMEKTIWSTLQYYHSSAYSCNSGDTSKSADCAAMNLGLFCQQFPNLEAPSEGSAFRKKSIASILQSVKAIRTFSDCSAISTSFRITHLTCDNRERLLDSILLIFCEAVNTLAGDKNLKEFLPRRWKVNDVVKMEE